ETRVASLMRWRLAVDGVIDAQRGALLPWVPVCLGVGIGAYFALMVEPGAAIWAGLALAALILAWAVAAAGVLARPLTLAVLLVLAGFLLAGTRTRAIETPVLGFRYYGPVEGRIVAI